MPTQWTWEDGGILMAVYMTQQPGGADLSQILAAADGINHAIPTVEELSTSLTKLLQYGVITNRADCFAVKPRHRPSLENKLQSRGGLFSSSDKGLKWLKKADLSQVNEQTVKVSETQVTTAYETYVGGIRKPHRAKLSRKS